MAGMGYVKKKEKTKKTRLTSTPHPTSPSEFFSWCWLKKNQATGKRCDTTSTSRAGRKIRVQMKSRETHLDVSKNRDTPN